jgi:hypothetical protein
MSCGAPDVARHRRGCRPHALGAQCHVACCHAGARADISHSGTICTRRLRHGCCVHAVGARQLLARWSELGCERRGGSRGGGTQGGGSGSLCRWSCSNRTNGTSTQRLPHQRARNPEATGYLLTRPWNQLNAAFKSYVSSAGPDGNGISGNGSTPGMQEHQEARPCIHDQAAWAHRVLACWRQGRMVTDRPGWKVPDQGASGNDKLTK